MGLEGFAMGLAPRWAPFTAPAPAKNKGQHLFGRGGQHRAWGGPWRGCPTAGHQQAGGQGHICRGPPGFGGVQE